MAYDFFAVNYDIPKEMLIGAEIEGVKYMSDMTILHLSNGCCLYFHHDTGETNLIKHPTSTNKKDK